MKAPESFFNHARREIVRRMAVRGGNVFLKQALGTCAGMLMVNAMVHGADATFEYILSDPLLNESAGASVMKGVSDDRQTFFGHLQHKQAVKWVAGQAYTDLSVPSNGNKFFEMIGCDGAGNRAVGYTYTNTEQGRTSLQGMQWSSTGGWVALELVPKAISRDGNVVIGSDGVLQGRLFTSLNGGASQTLASPFGDADYFATAAVTSADGRVIFAPVSKVAGFAGAQKLVRWSAGIPAIVPTSSELKYFLVGQASSDGEVVVGQATTARGGSTAFRVRSDGVFERLARLISSKSSINAATATSEDGALVAGFGSPFGDEGNIYIWNKTGAVRALGDILISGHGVPFSPGYRNFDAPLKISSDAGAVSVYGQTGWKATFPDPNQGPPATLPGGSMLDPQETFKPTIRFRETVKQSLKVHPPNIALVTTSSTVATVVASIEGLDVTTLNAATAVGLKLGAFQHDSTLGAADNFNPGQSAVTYTLSDGLNKAGTIKYSWRRSRLTVQVRLKNAGALRIASDRYTGWTGSSGGWVPVQIAFAGLSGKRDAIYLTGKSAASGGFILPGGASPTVLSSVAISGSEKSAAQ